MADYLRYPALRCWLAVLCCGALALATARVRAEGDGDAMDRYADANLRRGQLLFIQCKACHEVAEGAPHKVGPNLHGIFGRRAGTAPGFEGYSEAVKSLDIVWTPAVMESWLARPGDVAPGLKMAFAGVPNEADRIMLVAYLLKATAEDAEETGDPEPGQAR